LGEINTAVYNFFGLLNILYYSMNIEGVFKVTFSFNPLWKMLIDKGMTKEQLRLALKISPSTIAKMGKGEYISLEVLEKICRYFNCQPGYLLEYKPDKEEAPADAKA